MTDVFGIGNPIVDVIVKIDENRFLDFNLKKGSAHMVDEETSSKFMDLIKDEEIKIVPGGDVVNTMTGIANLGGTSIFCGKIGLDNFGILLEETMTKDSIRPILIKSKDKTGSCLTLVTPDHERTMIVHLGAAISLQEKEIIIEDIKKSQILYVTGYILEDAGLKKTATRAMNEAKSHDKKIAIDVSDPSLVERCKDELNKIIDKYADIIIANEDEAYALTGKKRKEALMNLGKNAEIAIVKIGKEGSYIREGDKIHKIPGFESDAVDTTGAGDMYSAGFLFGITNGYSVKEAGLIGSFAASKVVQLLGSRLTEEMKKEIKEFIKREVKK